MATIDDIENEFPLSQDEVDDFFDTFAEDMQEYLRLAREEHYRRGYHNPEKDWGDTPIKYAFSPN